MKYKKKPFLDKLFPSRKAQAQAQKKELQRRACAAMRANDPRRSKPQ